MPPHARFRVRMQTLRRVRGMSQTQLGDAIGIDRTVVSKLESGRRGVSLDEAIAIAEALDIPLSDMTSDGPVQVPVDMP